MSASSLATPRSACARSTRCGSSATARDKGAIVSFAMKGAHAHDVATILDRSGIAVRAGTHCAMPLLARFGVTASCRASFALYNTREEVDMPGGCAAESRGVLHMRNDGDRHCDGAWAAPRPPEQHAAGARPAYRRALRATARWPRISRRDIRAELTDDGSSTALKTVYDPEIPVDVYELGLIYRIDIADDRAVDVDMTLTAPNCPSAGECRPWWRTRSAQRAGRRACRGQDGVDPPWEPCRMSDEARIAIEHVVSRSGRCREDRRVPRLGKKLMEKETRMARPRPQVMRLSEAAATRIRRRHGKAERPVAGVRVGVKNGGCAGMSYTMEYAESVRPARRGDRGQRRAAS